MSQFVLRAMLPSDEGFIAKTWWLNSLSYWTKSARLAERRIDEARFGKWHYGVVSRMLASPGVRVVVVGPEGDTETILGFAVMEGRCVHMVHVRESMRRLGLARELLAKVKPNAFTVPSHGVPEFLKSKTAAMSAIPLFVWTLFKESPNAETGRSEAA